MRKPKSNRAFYAFLRTATACELGKLRTAPGSNAMEEVQRLAVTAAKHTAAQRKKENKRAIFVRSPRTLIVFVLPPNARKFKVKGVHGVSSMVSATSPTATAAGANALFHACLRRKMQKCAELWNR